MLCFAIGTQSKLVGCTLGRQFRLEDTWRQEHRIEEMRLETEIFDHLDIEAFDLPPSRQPGGLGRVLTNFGHISDSKRCWFKVVDEGLLTTNDDNTIIDPHHFRHAMQRRPPDAFTLAA